MAYKSFFYVRKFLNKEAMHSIGLIHGKIKVEWRRDKKTGKRFDFWDEAFLTIGDCSRQITLDFGIANEKEYSNSIHKAELLLEEIQKFRDGLIAAHDYVVKNKEEKG